MQSLAGFLEWTNLGHVIAGGNLRIGDIKGKPEIEKARLFGEKCAS